MLLEEESHLSNLSTEKQDDGDIRCPNCNWYFSTNTKPYILPCFHNLCDKCINILIEQKNPKCPICSNIFTHEEKNPFQVNFAFLNLVTKILSNKVIFCKKCYKIFYWFEHYIICDQENFIDVDDIFNEIKNYCEDGIKIIKLFNTSNNENFNILIKYKNEIMVLVSKLINKLRKKNNNKIKKEIEKIFKGNKKEKLELDYKDIKNNLINFLLICIDFSEHFDKNDIIKAIEPYISNGENKNEFSNIKKLNIITNRKNLLINKSARNYNSSNNTLLRSSNYKIEKEHICENKNNINKNNNKILLAKTPTKKKNENESLKIFKLNNKALNKTIYSPLVIKFNGKQCSSDNKENKQIENKNNNKKEKESDEELINNFDDDYHEYETEMNYSNNNNLNLNDKIKNINEIYYIPSNNKLKLIKNQNNKKIINIKDIFEKSLLQDSQSEKKLIIGLNEIKVISLKKKIDKKESKLKTEEINKNKNDRIKANGNIVNLKKTYQLSNDKKDNLFKINNKKRINSISSINELNSPDLKTKENNNNKLLFNKNDDIKVIKKYVSPKVNIKFIKKINNNNNLKLKKNNEKTNIKLNINNNGNILFLNRSNNNIIKKKPFINLKNINNNYFLVKNKKNVYINNLSNPNNNKSMNKIFNNFNNMKDIISKSKKYVKFIKYIYNNLNNNLNQNISLLTNNISQDYNLLLDDVVNNYINIQRRFLFSFKNNTKFLILFDTENNYFVPLDLSDILQDFPNFNSSIQFEFIENNDKYLLFITGGNERIINEKTNYSNDSFLIINVKINIDINTKNKINYKKKYLIEYKDKMPKGKSNHSIIFYNDNLYIIGGFDSNKKASNDCFYFSYKNKKWNDLPKLNIPRANSSVCLYNKSLLYLFGGRNNEGELNTIEYLNINEIDNNNNSWILINVIDYGCVWNNMFNSCNVIIGENKILIFGGEDENKLYKESFLFDTKNNNIYRGMNLKIPGAFMSQGTYNNGKIYGFDFKNKNGDYEHKIHIFDVKNNYWSIINTDNNNTNNI